MNKISPKYHSYLLRLWWVDNAGQPVWRISVEEPGSQTQTHFDSLAALCTYLAQQLRVRLKKRKNRQRSKVRRFWKELATRTG